MVQRSHRAAFQGEGMVKVPEMGLSFEEQRKLRSCNRVSKGKDDKI